MAVELTSQRWAKECMGYLQAGAGGGGGEIVALPVKASLSEWANIFQKPMYPTLARCIRFTRTSRKPTWLWHMMYCCNV